MFKYIENTDENQCPLTSGAVPLGNPPYDHFPMTANREFRTD
jgi:hypothetical protein